MARACVPAVLTSAWSSRRSAVVFCHWRRWRRGAYAATETARRATVASIGGGALAGAYGVGRRVDAVARETARALRSARTQAAGLARAAQRGRRRCGAGRRAPVRRGEAPAAEEAAARSSASSGRARTRSAARTTARAGSRSGRREQPPTPPPALWATLARTKACAAIVIKEPAGQERRRSIRLYRASRKATRPPLFSSKGAHLFVAKKEGTWAWILGDWSAYEASEARGWATSTTVCVGAPPCGKHDFLVADGRGGFQLQWLHCEVVSSRSIAADDRAARGLLCLATRRRRRPLRPRATLPSALLKREDAPSKTARVRQAAAASLQGREGGGQRHRAGLPDGRQEQRRPRHPAPRGRWSRAG